MFAIEPHGVAIARLETAGLIRPVSDGFRTTRRWQGLVARVAAGMRLVANDPTGARILAARVKSVRFEVGDAPGLSLEETVLRVVYNPLTGVRGRPASSDVSHFLEETL